MRAGNAAITPSLCALGFGRRAQPERAPPLQHADAHGRLWLGGFETKAPIEAHTAELVGHPDRVEAIKGIVRERCLIC